MQIKDFASKYQIQTDTIRFYEKENLLKPIKKENGYREYNEECEKQLQFIIVLKNLGFTIKEIKQLLLLKDQPISIECNNSTVLLFEQKTVEIEKRITFYQNALKLLQQVKALVCEGKYMENKEVLEELILVFIKSSYGRDLCNDK